MERRKVVSNESLVAARRWRKRLLGPTERSTGDPGWHQSVDRSRERPYHRRMSGPEFAGGSSVVVRGSRRRANVLRAAGLENVTGAARYIDRIVKGAAVSDLHFEEPTEIRLAINLRTARSLSLTIPATILARADEMIE